jgi:tetratricopeptide (TPR) repeat protein
LKKYPDDEGLLAAATQVYITYECYSNALVTLEQQLKISPTNLTALVNKGNVCIWLGKYAQAIPPLTRALALETNNPYALMNRAIANLRCGKLDEAQRDYEVLQKSLPTSPRVNYGLQEIAYRKKDTNAAIRYCQLYLANAQTNTAEAKIVSERLKELRPGSR